MRSSIREWGTPHGIAGTITAQTAEEATVEATKILFYRMGLSYHGGHYELFKERHHTAEDVIRAKEWLKKNQDVVSIKVTVEGEKSN
jgi:hypothetical protein